MIEPERLCLVDDGRFPNSELPLLLYRQALPADAETMLHAFRLHGWSNGWRDGIFTFHHFHSVTHEVLGIAAGEVRVMLGGPAGQVVALREGDVVVIPAGVAHRNVGQSADLLVVGAYPGGAAADIRKGAADEYAAAKRAIAAVQRLAEDPVSGGSGWLHRFWGMGG